jgi:outer membrane protein TolC
VHPRPARHPIIATALLAALAVPAAAQTPRGVLALPQGSPFLGGVPDTAPPGPPITVSLADAIRRSLDRNLGAVEALQDVDRASARRAGARSNLWPELHASLSASRRTTSLEAFGLPLGPEFPRVVGPYNVFDGRLFASQAIVDVASRRSVDAQTHEESAARLAYRGARDTVVLVTASLYLQTLAAGARVESVRAQMETSQALLDQARNMRESGLVAGLDVVRAEVRLLEDRQRATAAASDREKLQLQLARVIGLTPGQPFALSDQLPSVPAPQITLEEALERAYRERPDYLAALERVRAAEDSRRAAQADRLPTVRVSANYGAIGLTLPTALPTFDVSGLLDVPLFRGTTNARLAEAEVELRSRRAEAEDLRAGIDYDVRAAFLDLRSTGEQLQAAERGRDLAAQQLAQSRDRFSSGVASSVEVVQAQEAVARASEEYISALYGFNVSKALLARSLGTAESAVERYLGGAAR